MANSIAEPLSCDTFVALPPATLGGRVIFGKNSDRPSDEVQEIVFFPAAVHDLGQKVECTYIEIEQVPKTYGVVLSRPSWLWGAEMGANECGVCIGNEAIWGKEEVCSDEALLGMDLVRLGLERADTAEKAVDVIVELVDKYNQGGNCMESQMTFTYYNSFLIADRKEAWILETSGKHWAAEKVKGNITAETMMTILRDKESGLNMEGAFMTTGSMVSILPQDPSLPCIHFFTGTPDPDRSVFKPFIFVENITQLLKTSSPVFGPEDPVKKKPRFHTKPDRRHELYQKHEQAVAMMESSKEKAKLIMEQIHKLEKTKIDEMEHILQNGFLNVDEAVNLFSDCVEKEISIYA
uniref:Secernin-3-like n=1 Tax=Crotalus adamanteus TaxID=8729 RepID=A0A0F7Z6D4_CROAD